MAERDSGTPIGPLLKTTFDVSCLVGALCFYVFADPLVVTLQSILEVFLVCIAGYILARKGILDKTTQKVRLLSSGLAFVDPHCRLVFLSSTSLVVAPCLSYKKFCEL